MFLSAMILLNMAYIVISALFERRSNIYHMCSCYKIDFGDNYIVMGLDWKLYAMLAPHFDITFKQYCEFSSKYELFLI